MLTLTTLSDEEIGRLCALPRRIQIEMFRDAEMWLAQNRDALEKKYPNKYICINARTLAYKVADTQAEAEHYGPPSPDGQYFLDSKLK